MSPPAQAAELRRQQNRADARRTILDATESLLAESGLGGFSMRGLVERCGYSAPTIYHYFGDKPGLIDAVLEERLEDLVAQLERAPAKANPVAQARALCLDFARWGIRNPTHYYLMNQPKAHELPPDSAHQKAVDLMSKPLNALIQSGQISEVRLELIRQSLWACLHGLISLPAVQPDFDWNPNLLEASVDVLLAGWLAEFLPSLEFGGGNNVES
ncbi:MAG TPA: TetR/AcrR family transcriptional regulator [Myxococcales bacterium]|nr:TetR/AcrR family transcriptional regulator [Myxococcales bacterium]HIL01179.1 TetR/AcrR family transcriptional regulator [Myxococcales bacterium]